MNKMKTLTVNGETFAIYDPEAARIDNTVAGEHAWSGKQIVDRLCPAFSASGSLVTCRPVEGYPLSVQAGQEATKLWRTGKNLYDFKKAVERVNLTAEGTSQRYGYQLQLPAGDYMVSVVSHTESSRYLYSRTRYADGTYSSTTNIVAGTDCRNQQFHLNAGDVLILYNGSSITGAGNESASNKLFSEEFDVQIEMGKKSTAYEAYRGGEFTPGETIPAQGGVNCLWADTGEIAVTGRADPVAILETLMGGAGNVSDSH